MLFDFCMFFFLFRFFCLWNIGRFIVLFMTYRHIYVLVYGIRDHMRVLFSAYKNVKSFYTGKAAQIYIFVYGIWARLFLFVYGPPPSRAPFVVTHRKAFTCML